MTPYKRLIDGPPPSDKQALARWCQRCIAHIGGVQLRHGETRSNIVGMAYCIACALHVARLGNPDLAARIKPAKGTLHRAEDYIASLGACVRWSSRPNDDGLPTLTDAEEQVWNYLLAHPEGRIGKQIVTDCDLASSIEYLKNHIIRGLKKKGRPVINLRDRRGYRPG